MTVQSNIFTVWYLDTYIYIIMLLLYRFLVSGVVYWLQPASASVTSTVTSFVDEHPCIPLVIFSVYGYLCTIFSCNTIHLCVLSIILW